MPNDFTARSWDEIKEEVEGWTEERRKKEGARGKNGKKKRRGLNCSVCVSWGTCEDLLLWVTLTEIRRGEGVCNEEG